MDGFVFSYSNYVKLLDLIKKQGTLCDYSEISADTDKYIILRHDVEFSPGRALALAEVEAGQNIRSTYFFQISNNAYNSLSEPNIERIRRINAMGHRIGLHFHLHRSEDMNEIGARVRYEIGLMSHVTGIEIDRFSYHRPSELVLKNRLSIPGIINAYDPLFFTYTDDIGSADLSKNVKYIADSRNEWSYLEPWRSPCDEFFKAYPRVQILCHPYSWSTDGYSIPDNLRSIIEENRLEFINTLVSETKYVKEYADEL